MSIAIRGPAHLDREPWHVVLNVDLELPWTVIEKQYKVLRSQNHPDRGGDASQFDRINKAFSAAKDARAAVLVDV